jgi:hypothetical protein
MKLDHEERPLRGARQEPAVEFGNVFRCEANVKCGPGETTPTKHRELGTGPKRRATDNTDRKQKP